MLTNGITLGMKKKGGTTFAILAGLKEVPELGVDPEKVDNTTLADTMKHSELGIGDPGDLAYKFKWENDANSSYRTLRAVADTKEIVSFEQTFPDGTKFHFDAQCSTKVSGGGVNSAVEFTLTLGLQTDIVVVNPSAGE
jgi:hypothetical protein